MHLDVAMRTLRRHGVWAALIVLLALATGWAVLRFVPPTWTAETRVLYAVTGLTGVDQGVPAGALAAARAAQDAELVASPAVLQPVIDGLGLQDVTAEELATAVQATATGTFLDVEVGLGDPAVAARVAESVVAQLALRAADDQLAPTSTAPDSPVVTLDLAVVAPAAEPERPSSPDPLLTMAGALLVGLFLAALLLTWRARTDQVVDDEHDLAAATPAPVLAHVRVPARRTLADALTQPPGDVAGLRTALLARAGERPHASVALVACGTAASLEVAAALARAYAGTGRDTVLVEGDLAAPRLAAGLGLQGPGLADVLAGAVSVVQAAHATRVPGLRVLVAGDAEGDRTDLVASRQSEKAWDDVRASAEVVVLATGPVDVAAAVLAAACDEVVLLVAPGRTRRDDVRAAAHALQTAGTSVGGVVWVSGGGRAYTT
ncbi:Wzz/FepE/Etk N-terminal domain-containing protein [Cellulomonas dongxiuzhuiae]|uniref:Wzz/FepE/Etk N-terminal domain-containing protein n=1 Tax=Cellulomonas dongxiuzhuiae TaxID=2819979 RepID=UPI001AAF7753|nr:Wzz/FepE/Etk N-terminal domain-containing protein [Cellulomonas dongxiuzhuiae]MBO3088776.1 hypothetical protein [Cellulomonas dongxiuzhuiae]